MPTQPRPGSAADKPPVDVLDEEMLVITAPDEWDATARFAEIEPPHWQVVGRDTAATLVLTSRLAEAVQLHAELIGPAVETLSDSLLAGNVDLCDEAIVEVLLHKRDLVRRQLHPTIAEVATTGAAVLGMTSRHTDVAPSREPARLRSLVHDAASRAGCGGDGEPCATAKLLALKDAYLDAVAERMNDVARSVIHRGTLAYDFDVRVLRSPSVMRTYGDGCGRSALAVALRIVGRSSREARSFARRAELTRRFHEVLALVDDPAPADVERICGAYLRAYWAVGYEQPAA